ncbi:MAG: T9SS type A sorting domain-containing protein [Bacteroidetes bacterium]|nr:T9SS type A sorting domain-containing protein [Bacteroidota bacterium]
MKKYLLAFLISQISCFAYAQSKICLDIGQPIDNSSGQIYLNYSEIAQTCTPNIRLNFILGPWNSPDDVTLHNGKTWKQTYDEMVDSLVNRGIQIYGLIGAQIQPNSIGDLLIAYPSDNTADSAAAAQWEQLYVYNFVSVVDKFKDRVHTFESYNEPNNWDNGWTSVVCTQWFAYILQDIYLNVKYFNGHWNDPAWQVNLISGALFTFDANDGSQYLDDTYWYGKNVWAWDWTNQETGSYPLDGIGQHLYVEQGSSVPSTITTALNKNINGMWNIIAKWEGNSTPKKIWVSEFGWESSNVTEQGQADNLKNSFALFLNDNRIALANWFTFMDWPGAYWGLYYFGNFSPSDRKLAYFEFQKLTNCNPVSVSENLNKEKFSLLFDAAAGNYILTSPSREKLKIEIWNSVGEKIIERNIPGGTRNLIINKENRPSGIYFLRAETENNFSVLKIIF